MGNVALEKRHLADEFAGQMFIVLQGYPTNLFIQEIDYSHRLISFFPQDLSTNYTFVAPAISVNQDSETRGQGSSIGHTIRAIGPTA